MVAGMVIGCGDDVGERGSAPIVAAPPANGEPHDVLLITLDTLRADRVGCYGNPRGLTPNLDRLAAEGTRFAAAVAPMPSTVPAHVALFTGLSPRLHGVTSNYLRAGDGLTMVAERMKALGFATGAFFNAFNFAELNLIQGFDGYGFDQGRRAERIVPALEQWLAATRGRRRFGWIHLYIPHGPLEIPAEYERLVRQRYDGPIKDDFFTLEKVRTGQLEAPPEFGANYRERYDAAVAFTDARVGEIRAAFEKAGSWDSTLVIVIADHGESLEGRTLGFHAPVIDETTLHVPMIWCGPGVAAGRVVPQLVQHMDVVPTVVARLGELIPSDVEGHDLSMLIDAADPVTVEWSHAAIATLPTHFEGKGERDPEAAAVRRGRFKLVLREGSVRELFDLESEAGETRDVGGAHPDVMRALEAAFEQWVRTTTDAAAVGGSVSPEMAAQLRKLGYQ